VIELRYYQIVGILLASTITGACDNPTAATKNAAPPAVRVAQVSMVTAITQIRGAGTAAWRNEATLGFTSGGQIARVFVNEGDRIRRGQLLATLNMTTVEADLSGARAEADRAASNAIRIDALYREGWVTKAQLEAANAAAQSTAAQVRARSFAMDTARIVASSNGMVLARLAEAKQVVAAGSPVLTIGEDDGGYIIRVPLNDRAAAAISAGAPASIMFAALGAQPLSGRVLQIGGRAQQSTGTFDVEIALPPDPRIRSGMIGTVAITSSARNAIPRIILPAGALISPRAGEALVYIIDAGNRARIRTVLIGETLDSGVEILSGLTGNEVVALSGFDKFTDGMRVTPVARAR
jgi:RND family efflux transporter MFP subunit